MRHYIPHDGTWTEAAPDTVDPPYVEVDPEASALRFVEAPESLFQLSGAPARSDAETVHTVAIIDNSLTDGMTLCALYAGGDNLTVEDRRPAEARTRFADAFEQLQSALDEILIPVYIDDAIEEVSESVDELVALHTARYADPPADACSYFRTSVFRDGNLLLEAEHGSL